MAKPRIFISSTYYDLRTVRSDLESAIRELGYEPILHEKGHVPYSKESSLEDACYREISTVDILVSIIGSRYGANASDGDHSISQQELRTALKLDKQVYIFVEKGVLSEHKTYILNREIEDIKYSSVDNIRIFRFLDDVFKLTLNNAVFPFETSSDIHNMLCEQFAGLFRDLLSQTSNRKNILLTDELTAAITSLREITSVVSKSISQETEGIRELVLTTHPIFNAIKIAMKVGYRVFFFTLPEMAAWLKARGYTPLSKDNWDDEEHMEFIDTKNDKYVRIDTSLFDGNGRLLPLAPDAWDDDMLTVQDLPVAPDDDEIPF